MTNVYFRLITENALDFLSRSVGEVENHPKYAVIHFAAAVELFLKARLVAEHWTLIVNAKRKEPDWEDFEKGDFVSVNLEEAASRLGKVIRSPLKKEALEAFGKVSRHRNRMIHFHHDATSGPEKEELRRGVVRELLHAQYFLNELLTGEWRDEFRQFHENIRTAEENLRELRAYLEVIFDELKKAGEFEKRKRTGSVFHECLACGFEAQEHMPEEHEPYEAKCLVCNAGFKAISTRCSDCGEHLIFVEDGYAKCNCGKSYKPEQLLEDLIDDDAAHRAAKGGDESWLGNCSECSGYKILVSKDMMRGGGSDGWFCAGCLEEFEPWSVEQCGWCGEFTNGNTELSWLRGCDFCDGNSKLLED